MSHKNVMLAAVLMLLLSGGAAMARHGHYGREGHYRWHRDEHRFRHRGRRFRRYRRPYWVRRSGWRDSNDRGFFSTDNEPLGWRHGRKVGWRDGSVPPGWQDRGLPFDFFGFNNTPPGWSHGRKVGWGGGGVPPGWQKHGRG